MEEPAVELPLRPGLAGMGGALCIDPEAASHKRQASSFKLDMAVGYDRMNLERNNYGQ